MYFIEEGKSFKIEFTEEDAKVIRQTKTLYFPPEVAKDFAQGLMKVSLKLMKHIMGDKDSLNGRLNVKRERSSQDTSSSKRDS